MGIPFRPIPKPLRHSLPKLNLFIYPQSGLPKKYHVQHLLCVRVWPGPGSDQSNTVTHQTSAKEKVLSPAVAGGSRLYVLVARSRNSETKGHSLPTVDGRNPALPKKP